ncbi:MAG: radical SAM protein [Nitrospirae bacterium]|nr:radical SAM protein [Nitrospirota bacterium]NTW65507.1 radical SAM protein [Nitrospirota bacterium]
MQIKEVKAKSILSTSQVSDYALNPYVGCQHACVYCYAKFMKRFTGHKEEWGAFVDVKVNAPELLAREVKKKKVGRVWISGVCDPYQPLERKYRLTRTCLDILVRNDWPVTVQTKSPLVLRDIEILRRASDVEVGFTITTADERMRKIFEPGAPPIEKRVAALKALRAEGIKTFAMIAPLLPGAEGLPALLKDSAGQVLVDRLNYHYADAVYKKYGMQWAVKDSFFREKGEELRKAFVKNGIPCQVLY